MSIFNRCIHLNATDECNIVAILGPNITNIALLLHMSETRYITFKVTKINDLLPTIYTL